MTNILTLLQNNSSKMIYMFTLNQKLRQLNISNYTIFIELVSLIFYVYFLSIVDPFILLHKVISHVYHLHHRLIVKKA